MEWLGTKPGFEWDVPEDRDVDAGDEARPHVEPPAPRPHDASVGGEDDAARVIYGEVCAICRDDVTRRGRIDACDHLFCLPCIKRWANIETKCPLCKARFSFIQPEDLVPPDPDARPSTRGAQRAELKRVYLPHKDQVYEGDGELPDGVDIEEVLCGRCGDGGDEDKLMLCDGCDQGYHCYCVGLDAVPLDEWRCQICADEDGDDGAEAQPASTRKTKRRRATRRWRGDCKGRRTPPPLEPNATISSPPPGNVPRGFVTPVTPGAAGPRAVPRRCARSGPIAGHTRTMMMMRRRMRMKKTMTH